MNERALAFGESNALFGILNEPELSDLTESPEFLGPQRPAVLIPSTGVAHRAGPSRMHVELARALAAAGVISLRFDKAGLGDSETVPGRGPDAPISDLRAAMDALDGRGLANGYIVIGLHTGAHDAHQVAKVDPRIVGAAFLDGYSHRTPRYWLNQLFDRLFDGKRPGDAPLRPQAGLTPLSGDALHDVLPSEIFHFHPPGHARMQTDLIEFMRRELALLYIYTGDLEHEYNYAAQLVDAFPLLRGYRSLSLRHLPESDHSFGRRATREALIELLVQWVLGVPGRR